MAIIGKVERKNWKVKILNICIHLLLLLGAVTMIYPLLIMISGSIKSNVDFFSFSLFPEYIYDQPLLFKKYLHTKFNNNNTRIFNLFRLPVGSLINLPVPENTSRERADDFKQFLTQMRQTKPHYWRGIGMAYEVGVIPLTLREYRAWLIRKFGPGLEGLDAVNAAYKTDFTSWDSVSLPDENFYTRRTETNYSTPLLKDLLEFKNTQITGFNTFWTDIDAPFVNSLRFPAGNRLEKLNRIYGTDYNTWSEITLPTRCPAGNPAFIKMWRDYVCERVNLIFITIRPGAKPLWHQFLRKKYNNDLHSFNRVHETVYRDFGQIPLPAAVPESGQLRTDWSDFVLEGSPIRHIELSSLVDEYRKWLRNRYRSLDEINQKFDLGYHSFEEIRFTETLAPGNLNQSRDWFEFVSSLNPEETGLSRNYINQYRRFIINHFSSRGRVDYKALSLAFKQEITSPYEIPFYSTFPVSPEIGSTIKDLYRKFILRPENAAGRTLTVTPEHSRAWVKFLKNKYKNDIKSLNRSWSLIYSDWNRISPPFAEYEWFNALDNRKLLIREYLKRNYIMVFDTILTNGFAARNTLIYCALAVLASLLVNPLCAYGLSRFKMPPAYKILLFLMLPMAFPAMVLGIPRFLLIKNLGLLNTFAALILPTMANGYMIFLLKGFFDSLPHELFESAELDGASEWTIFWHIAMGLSTPILSVLALNTFTAAYGNFMMAFLLCQDKSMWTMMVYLYQLQQNSSQAVGFAALIIAAIPTLLVFIFCQNIIIKGIVVPSEK